MTQTPGSIGIETYLASLFVMRQEGMSHFSAESVSYILHNMYDPFSPLKQPVEALDSDITLK